ncbi:hypothetical protein H072_2569 [Dactylellina haptotyla CBS 200.50]|uniref:Uncharacterized protein n=1 Tax=Dactylellina haptotyla (strain CBS 200.50) TaxID=1284197 RepID=S8AKK4_DACHA|nr:hypothetical protein H072_2569 [Dactylellina haptotyla CBS 200.50]
MIATKLSPLKLSFGVIVFLSFLLFWFSSYRISNVIPIDLTKGLGCPDPTTCESTAIKTKTVVKTITATTTSTSFEITTTTAKAAPTGRVKSADLEVEQIEADFPNQYHNPNNWFKTPAQPNIAYLRDLLSDEEKALLPAFRATAQYHPENRAKIESLYGINRTGSWQDHIKSLDDEGLSPLTKWTQQYIYNHQHPASCEGKKFYIVQNRWHHHGLGALVRRVFLELSLAMQANRIMVFDTNNAPGNSLVEGNCGRHRGKVPSLECVVEEMTSCAAYVTANNSVRSIDVMETREGGIRDYPTLPGMALISYLAGLDIVPSGTFLRYWWRSQLYGYILRPNDATLARMAEMRMNQTLHTGVATNRSDLSKPINMSVPFPLPPATISMHIRHGDKAGEGRLITTRDYIVAAERFLLRNPLRYVKRAFMSTEDPGAIAEARRTPFVNPVRSYGNVDWTWYYSNIPRVDGGPGANLVLTHNKTDALITHIMQLWMAVECDTFVGNRNSNWNKMIDAIRCTLIDKCRAPYLDAGYAADWINFP